MLPTCPAWRFLPASPLRPEPTSVHSTSAYFFSRWRGFPRPNEHDTFPARFLISSSSLAPGPRPGPACASHKDRCRLGPPQTPETHKPGRSFKEQPEQAEAAGNYERPSRASNPQGHRPRSPDMGAPRPGTTSAWNLMHRSHPDYFFVERPPEAPFKRASGPQWSRLTSHQNRGRASYHERGFFA